MLQIATVDVIIFITYIIAVLLIGFWVGRKEKKEAAGYFLAGRTLPWYAIGFSMIATSISTEQFIGAGAKSYEVGMAVLHWEWGMLPAFTLLALIFLPIYFRRKIYTMPEYLERRCNQHYDSGNHCHSGCILVTQTYNSTMEFL